MIFVRKMYLILAFQLISTFIGICIVQTHEKYSLFMNKHSYINIVCCILSFVTLLLIVCYLGWSYPLNYLLLIIFTIFEAYMVAGFTASFMNLEVIVAGLGTALVIISLTIYSRFTMEEVEVGPAITSIICMALIPILVVCALIKASLVYIIVLIIILVLYSFFIVLDTIIICHSCKSMGG